MAHKNAVTHTHTHTHTLSLSLSLSLSLFTDPAFLGELGAADVIYDGKRVGVIGVVHPLVLGNFDLKYPVSAFELAIEFFL